MHSPASTKRPPSPPPSHTHTPQWHVNGTCITPSPEFTQSLNAFCAKSRSDDPTIRFLFNPSPIPASLPPNQDFIHISRLTFANGPLAALVHADFSERQTRTVNLCPEDDPPTFALIRNFLYGIQIHLDSVPLPQLLRVVRSAHRWQLVDLFAALCAYISTHGLLCDAPALLMAVDIVALPDLPHGFRNYFWNSAAKFFLDLSSPEFRKEAQSPNPINPTLDARIENRDQIRYGGQTTHTADEDAGMEAELDSLPIHHRLCPHFPDIWDLALSHGALVKLINDIRQPSIPGLNASLLDLVVRYLEGRIPDDDTVFALIELLGPDAMRQEYLFDRGVIDRTCSARAVRLLAKSLIAPTEPLHNMSFSWDMSLVTIAPCRQNFLYGACVPASRGSRSRWDPNLFDASSAIHFHIESVAKNATYLQTMKRKVVEVAFNIRWDVGACFPFKGKKMEFRLGMRRKRVGGVGRVGGGEELYVICRRVELTQKTGTFREVVEKEVLEDIELDGGDLATLVLNIRLVNV